MANNDPKSPIPEAPVPTATATAEELALELIEFHRHPEHMTPEQLLDIDEL